MKATLFILFFSCYTHSIAQIKTDTIESNFLLEQYQQKRAEAIAKFESFPAADFEAKDMDGNIHRLSYYKGQVVLLVFGNTFCDPCLRQIPSLTQLVEETDSLSLQILSFVDDTEDEMKAYVDRYWKDVKPQYPIIPNSMDFSALSYGGEIGFPRIFIIDKNGVTYKIYTDSDAYDEQKIYKDLKPIIADLLKF